MSHAGSQSAQTQEAVPKPEPQLRALTTLKWPYVEDEDKTFEDPLTRNDPKQLRTAHYEGLATSPRLRELLNAAESQARLRTMLARLDALGERERAQALETLLVGDAPGFDEVDVRIFRAFAKEVEECNARVDASARRDRLGLDWDEESEAAWT